MGDNNLIEANENLLPLDLTWSTPFARRIQIMLAQQQWTIARCIIDEAEQTHNSIINMMKNPMELHVQECGLENRTSNMLEKAGIDFVWQLAETKDYKLARISNFGKITIKECRRMLDKLGVKYIR